MSEFIDYYKILGVQKDIKQEEIKKAYRKRAKQFHPDLHPNDPKAKAKFQLLGEAYEILNDPQKRKEYNEWREQWISEQKERIYESARESPIEHSAPCQENTTKEQEESNTKPIREKSIVYDFIDFCDD